MNACTTGKNLRRKLKNCKPELPNMKYKHRTLLASMHNKDGITVRYVQNLNMAYFRNLPYRTNVMYQKEFLHAYRIYVLFLGWYSVNQRWSRGHKARDQGQGQGQCFRGQNLSRPRTGMLEAKAKDQGHKRKCSPKKKKKKVFTKFFQAISKKKRSSQKFFKQSPQKNAFQKFFQALQKILTIQKIVLSLSRGQANFRGLEALRPRPRTSKSVLEDVLEAKDVFEDCTSAVNVPYLKSTVRRSISAKSYAT